MITLILTTLARLEDGNSVILLVLYNSARSAIESAIQMFRPVMIYENENDNFRILSTHRVSALNTPLKTGFSGCERFELKRSSTLKHRLKTPDFLICIKLAFSLIPVIC